MKVLMSTTMLLGFLLSIGIDQVSKATVVQPIAPLTHQEQLIQVKWRIGHLDSSHIRSRQPARSHVIHHRAKSNVEQTKGTHRPHHGIRQHFRSNVEQTKGTHRPHHGTRQHFRSNVEQTKGTHRPHHGIRQYFRSNVEQTKGTHRPHHGMRKTLGL